LQGELYTIGIVDLSPTRARRLNLSAYVDSKWRSVLHFRGGLTRNIEEVANDGKALSRNYECYFADGVAWAHARQVGTRIIVMVAKQPFQELSLEGETFFESVLVRP